MCPKRFQRFALACGRQCVYSSRDISVLLRCFLAFRWCSYTYIHTQSVIMREIEQYGFFPTVWYSIMESCVIQTSTYIACRWRSQTRWTSRKFEQKNREMHWNVLTCHWHSRMAHRNRNRFRKTHRFLVCAHFIYELASAVTFKTRTKFTKYIIYEIICSEIVSQNWHQAIKHVQKSTRDWTSSCKSRPESDM